MNDKLNVRDIFALGFMTFAFFLGAGNIIFPPQAGLFSGEHTLPAMLGFLITAVGLPLSGIVAVAISGGGWKGLTKELPFPVATLIAVSIFIIIGPAFAGPRAGLVAYEMAFKPFLSDAGQLELSLFSIVFFSVSLFLSLNQGKLIDTIGKFLTPALFIGLIILAVGVFVAPQGEIGVAQGAYVDSAFTKGFLEGYNTMDTFAALMFGMLIVDVIRKKGITSQVKTCRYLILAGTIAAIGLSFVYISLFYLGATSTGLVFAGANGGEILSAYVLALFGPFGQIILSAIILLACLTTAIGLISACADYFAKLTRVTYQQWVVLLSIICAIVANVGLNQLIEISIPVLFALYPVAIILIVLTFLRPFIPNPVLAYRLVLGVSFIFSLFDAAKVLGFDVSALNSLPLFTYGLAWLLPAIITLIVVCFIGPNKNQSSIA